MIRTILPIFLSIALLPTLLVGAEKPNIIIFYVDDLGWQDVQLNELDDQCPYETPNIVKLAESGMNITQGYSPAPTCSPSRAGILTGQHPAKIGMTHVDLGVLNKGSKNSPVVSPYLQGPLDLKLLTLADAMKANGYRTGHSGKWHVGLNAMCEQRYLAMLPYVVPRCEESGGRRLGNLGPQRSETFSRSAVDLEIWCCTKKG